MSDREPGQRLRAHPEILAIEMSSSPLPDDLCPRAVVREVAPVADDPWRLLCRTPRHEEVPVERVHELDRRGPPPCISGIDDDACTCRPPGIEPARRVDGRSGRRRAPFPPAISRSLNESVAVARRLRLGLPAEAHAGYCKRDGDERRRRRGRRRPSGRSRQATRATRRYALHRTTVYTIDSEERGHLLDARPSREPAPRRASRARPREGRRSRSASAAPRARRACRRRRRGRRRHPSPSPG